MAQTMAVNAIAPFVICSKLKPSMMSPFPLNEMAKRKNKKADSDKGNEGSGHDCSFSSLPLPLPLPVLDECYSHIVNVTALEGKFNVGKKSGGHPHTVTHNMTQYNALYSLIDGLAH
jgi:NAD(P)-dependent dehydrogenase (short-subunit alcohol dehydrogenase family)